ncbi:putative F-box/FBD/LRR-repeat protein At3g49030 [Bidens hawaiensis]|uniref:putative F-box/FBD/LRR-repeat protein At3g49030 n=1 Tax=Bidens hawaiensis TaxID=980011 RepID=UPI00404AB601
MDVEVGTDRLSSLPDDLIHKILSFLNITEVIGNSVLSPRWRYIWTSMPYLTFSTEDFSTLPKFSKFVTQVLSRRNNLTEVYSVKLSFRGKVSQVFVRRILNYAFSHNVQQLNVVFLHEKDTEIPLSLFSSQSLKHLSLEVNFKNVRRVLSTYSIITPTPTWELPALTTLDLHSVALCDDEAEKCVGIFSKCANLKNLTLRSFRTMGSDGFNIVHPRLSNLTLEHGRWYSVKVVNVVAPQLENLTIKSSDAEHAISAPNLASLCFKGSCPLPRSTNGFCSLEKADICVSYLKDADTHQIVNLLHQLYNVRFLTLNLEIVELLSSSVELVLHQASPFVNLKRLNIYPLEGYWSEQSPKKVAMSPELKSYLLDGSPGCTFTMVLREEITAKRLIAELRVLIRKEKDNIKTRSAHVETHEPKKLKTMGNMAQMKGHWENLGVQIELRKETVFLIISKLQRIEEIVTKLPASNMARIQACFSSLCEEANIAISIITDCMKVQCDENQSRSSVCLHELATSVKLSP